MIAVSAIRSAGRPQSCEFIDLLGGLRLALSDRGNAMEMERDSLLRKVIGCAIEVHRELGPGLLESTYEACLAREFITEGIACVRQAALPVVYKGQAVDCGYRLDFVVENRLILELKSIDQFAPIHTAQMLTYLKLTKLPRGLLLNFNVRLLKSGIRSIVLSRGTCEAEPLSP